MARTPEEIKAQKAEYMRNYVRDPEKAAARAAYMKAYTADPENKARKLAYDKAYQADPEKKAERLAYRSRPEIQARDAENRRRRLATSEGRAKLVEYTTSPERQARRRDLARADRVDNPEKVRGKARRDRARIKEKFNLLKTGRPCYDCGGTFPPEAMDWDHLPGATKSFTVARGLLNRSADEVLAEIDKCQLVCACCHRTRTLLRCRKEAK